MAQPTQQHFDISSRLLRQRLALFLSVANFFISSSFDRSFIGGICLADQTKNPAELSRLFGSAYKISAESKSRLSEYTASWFPQ